MSDALRDDDASRVLLEAAATASDFTAWQGAVFEVLETVGYDVAFVKILPPAGAFASRGFEAAVLARTRARWSVYERELMPVTRAAQRDGVATDDEVLGPARRRLAYHRDLVEPQRGTSSLYAHLAVGGREVGGLLLGRSGSAFNATDLARVRRWIAPLSLGAAAMAWGAPSNDGRATPAVTAREGEVLRLVQLGYTNPEIARSLGSSPNTVRNQVSSLLRKLGATTRAELVGLTVRP